MTAAILDEKARPHSALDTVETRREGQIYEAMQLDENRFNLWSTIGIQFSVTAAPLGIVGYTTLITGVGGSPFYFWGFLVAVVGQILIAVSLAELSSAYPHSSGQIYWTASLSPPRYARFLSYLNGAMTTFGWVFASSGTAVFAADFFAAFGQLVSDTYEPTSWQIFLLVIAALTVAFILNTLLIKAVPNLTSFMVVFLNIAALFICITLLAVVHPKASPKTAFIDVVNTTGWSSDGLVFFLGLLPGMMTVCLFDTAAHMADELPHPEREVPIVMLANAVLSSTGGLVMVLCLIFCTTHPESLVQPLAGMPILQICWDAWSSKGFVIVVCLIYWAMTLNGLISIITGCSRVIWSFAKAGGLPFKDLLSEVNGRFQTPLNAVLASCIACAIFSLLCFAPLTVLNGLFGASVVCFTTSYTIPTCLVLANRRNLPSNRYFNIGAAGPVVNFVAICWMVISALFVCFPQHVPVTLGTMNWAPVIFCLVLFISLANWLRVKATYCCPGVFFVTSQVNVLIDCS